MKKFKIIWNICFTLALTGFTGYAMADTFLLSRVYKVVDAAQTSDDSSDAADADQTTEDSSASVTDTS